jgi:aldose 1-epimerase
LHRSTLSREVFGTLDDGAAVEAVTLVNANGMSVRIIGYGASIQSVRVPDRYGELADVTAGYATLDDYIRHPQFFGSTVGRVANRVAGARFILNGIEYDVPANDGTSQLDHHDL